MSIHQKIYSNWLRLESPFLWDVIRYDFVTEASGIDVFLHLDTQIQKYAQSRRGYTEQDLNARFIRGYLKRGPSVYGSREDRTIPVLGLDLGPLSPEQRFILMALFVHKKNISLVADWLKIAEPPLLYRAGEALSELSSLTANELTQAGTECSRFDLFLPSFLLNLDWKDPLKAYPKTSFQNHLNECSRCQKIHAAYKHAIEQMQKTGIQTLPEIIQNRIKYIQYETPKSPTRIKIPAPRWRGSKATLSLTGITLTFILVLLSPKAREFLESQFLNHHENIQLGVLPEKSPTLAAPALPSETPPIKEIVPVKSVVATNISMSAPETISRPKTEASLIPATTDKTAAPPPPLSKPLPTASIEAPTIVTSSEFLRMGAVSTDASSDSKKVMEILRRYTIERAGEFDLGAIYRNGYYFHFLLPSEHLNEVIQKIKALPFKQFTKTVATSDRKISKKFTRIVLWVGPANSSGSKNPTSE